MKRFTSPLDNIHIASPCPANWEEMFGDDRKRFCGDCKLNVYNLSDMTRQDAENLIISSEGHLCVRFFRRADGTVLTKNCPVGWAAVKQRVSRVATALFSLIVGLVGGLFAFSLLRDEPKPMVMGEMVVDPRVVSQTLPYVGEVDRIEQIDTVRIQGQMTMGKPVFNAKPDNAPRVERVGIQRK